MLLELEVGSTLEGTTRMAAYEFRESKHITGIVQEAYIGPWACARRSRGT